MAGRLPRASLPTIRCCWSDAHHGYGLGRPRPSPASSRFGGIGIIEVPHAPEARLRLVVRLVGSDAVERLPDPAKTGVLGLALPVVQIAPLEVSAPLKVLLALLRASR